ncbi:MAG: hypothetical protein J6A83_09820, partial [Clostridia bacterium]|nr:hypothetical protein [Clostridia bacterium]
YSFIEVTTLTGNTAGVLDFAVTSDKAYNYVALYTETKQAALFIISPARRPISARIIWNTRWTT